MRIDVANRMNGVSSRNAAGRGSVGQGYAFPGLASSASVAAAPPTGPVTALEAILALQGVGDGKSGRRRAIKRGTVLLDLLEQLKTDLLVGRIAPECLDALSEQLGGLRETVEPELDALLDDIDLRVRVELAKLDRFPP